MRWAATTLILACAFAFGCAAVLRRPDPDWLADFDRANSIIVSKKKQSSITIRDTETLQRLRKIYSSSRWKPYVGTIPGDIDHRTIAIADGERVLRRFTTALGLFWESGSYTENRTTELNAADSVWIENLFARLSDTDGQVQE